MLTVNDTFPDFDLPAVLPGGELGRIRSDDPDGWLVLFFWPKDFTFVCPTEIAGYAELTGATLLGGSVDNEYVHLAWTRHEPLLAELPFPLLADVRRDLCRALGILDPTEGVPLRATFVVDPERRIRHVTVNDLDTGRNPAETLRTLRALQAGGLTACGWQPGDTTLDAA